MAAQYEFFPPSRCLVVPASTVYSLTEGIDSKCSSTARSSVSNCLSCQRRYALPPKYTVSRRSPQLLARTPVVPPPAP